MITEFRHPGSDLVQPNNLDRIFISLVIFTDRNTYVYVAHVLRTIYPEGDMQFRLLDCTWSHIKELHMIFTLIRDVKY